MIKSFFSVLTIIGIFVVGVAEAAEKTSYLDEAKALGSIAGQGLACRAKKYHKYELIARAIVVSKAKSNKMQEDGLQTFNDAKVSAFMEIESENFSECDEVVYAFNRQKIFDAVLYRNGKIKMPDGSMIVPRKEYDVSKLYQRDPQAFAKADEAYKKAVAQALQNSEKQQKIKLHDANYEKFANQFQ